MADIDTVANRLEQATIKAENAANTLDAIVEGGISDSITSDGGNILPSIEKWYNDNFAALTTVLNNQVSIATTKAIESANSATESEQWANYPDDTLVPAGNLVDDYSSKHHRNKAELAQIASEAARDVSTTKATESSNSALESERWAEHPEDTEIPGNVGQYSSKHHAIKSFNSATESEQWANYPDDTLVPAGNLVDDYSSKHHRNKAELAQIACENIQASLASGVLYKGDWSANAGTTPTSPTEGSHLYRISVAGTINSESLDIDDLLYFDQLNDTWKGIKNGFNILLSDLGGVASSGGTFTGKLNISANESIPLNLKINNANIDDSLYINFSDKNSDDIAKIGLDASKNVVFKKESGTELKLTNTEAKINNNNIWHSGNFNPTDFSINPTWRGIVSFSSDEELVVKGTLERIQNNGNITLGSSYKTVLINGGEHNNSTAYNNWKVYDHNVDAQGLIISNEGLQYGVATASSNNQNVNATVYKVWHSGNDGIGSGLDADTLDGQQLSEICVKSQSNTLTDNTPIVLPTTDISPNSSWRFTNTAPERDFSISWHNGSIIDTSKQIIYDWSDNRWEIAGGLQLRSGDLNLETNRNINFSGACNITSNTLPMLYDADNGNVVLNANNGTLFLGYNYTTNLEFRTNDIQRGYVNSTGSLTWVGDVLFTGKATFNNSEIDFSTNLDMNNNYIGGISNLRSTSNLAIRPNNTSTDTFTFTSTSLSTNTNVDINSGGVINSTKNDINTFVGPIKAKTFVTKYNNEAGYITNPGGAQYNNSVNNSITGAIKIKLPTHGSDDMLTFTVDIFDYSIGETVSLKISGYLYQTTGNNEWVNETVTILSGRVDKDFNVRFGADGTSNCVWIGETTSTWSYPQILVKDFYSAFTTNIDNYIEGWSISIVNSFDTIDETISDNYVVAKQLKTSRSIGLGGSLAGSANFDGSSNIVINATVNDNSHAHTISNVTGLQSALDSKLSISGKSADSNLFDGLDSTQFVRSDTSDQIQEHIEIDYGIHSGYGNNNGVGSDWGANIWSMGVAYSGSHAGPGFTLGGYSLGWLRSGAAEYDTKSGEGIYLVSQNIVRGGWGSGGFWCSGNVHSAGTVFENSTPLNQKYLGLNSNAVSSSKFNAPMQLSLTGGASGSVSFDGSSNVSLNVTVSDSHTHSQYITSNSNDVVTANTRWDDGFKATFGNSEDLQIYHSGSANYIDGLGNLYIRGTGLSSDIYMSCRDSNNVNKQLLGLITDGTNGYLAAYHNSTLKLTTTSTGITVWGELNVTSDRKLKKDIKLLESNKSDNIQAFNFSLKEDKENRKKIGYIADNVEKYLPESVSISKHNGKEYKTVDYIAVHTAKINNLEKIIKQQQEIINNLTEKLNILLDKES